MSNKIEITTWNVNSVRKRLNSISIFLKDFIPDILLLGLPKSDEKKVERCYNLGVQIIKKICKIEDNMAQ